MDRKIVKFDYTEIEEHKFHQNKNLFLKKDIDINKILVSNKLSLKYIICYRDNKTIRALCLFFPESWIERWFNRTKCIYFAIKDELTFEYMRILENVSDVKKKKITVKLYIMKII